MIRGRLSNLSSLSKKVLNDKDKGPDVSVNIKANQEADGLVTARNNKKTAWAKKYVAPTLRLKTKLPTLLPARPSLSSGIFRISADGKQFVMLASHKADGVGVFDWWEDAEHFSVQSFEHTAYRINPPIEVNIID